MVLRTRRFVDRVVVVDDGGSDRTSEVAALSGVVVLRHVNNEGKGVDRSKAVNAENSKRIFALNGLAEKGGRAHPVQDPAGPKGRRISPEARRKPFKSSPN